MDKYIIYLYISAWILVMPKSYSRGKLQKRETVFIGFIGCCRGASHITILHHKSQIDYVPRALGTFARFKNVIFSGKLTHLPGIFFLHICPGKWHICQGQEEHICPEDKKYIVKKCQLVRMARPQNLVEPPSVKSAIFRIEGRRAVLCPDMFHIVCHVACCIAYHIPCLVKYHVVFHAMFHFACYISFHVTYNVGCCVVHHFMRYVIRHVVCLSSYFVCQQSHQNPCKYTYWKCLSCNIFYTSGNELAFMWFCA